MIDDPRRLRDVGSPRQRALLDALHRIDVPGDAREETWRRLASSVGAGAVGATLTVKAAAAAGKLGGAGAASTGSATLKTAGLGWLAKGAAVAALAGTATIPVAVWLSTEAPAPNAAIAPVKSSATTHAPRAVAPAAVVAPVAAESLPAADEQGSAERANAAARVTPRPSSDAQASLLQESAALRRARAELRGGDTDGARRTLDKLARDNPKSALSQERQLLRIEALAASGQQAAAGRAAAAFLREFPGSPHSGKVAQFLEK